VKNPVALNLADEVRRTVAGNDVVNDTLNRAGELLQLQNYFRRKEQKIAASAEATGMEKMIIAAFQNNVQLEAIESMRNTAGITDIRFAELKKQANVD
ncbi:MAG: hypothetical protein FWC89_14155, partial [Defluviitaleaceae bacterium]|nr:hypothetical protein [Defluviitaleaceae bacterium]